MDPAPRPADLRVLLIGAGGIGCPAAWALVRAGVGSLTVIDPDRVEESNLPRQLLYAPADIGRSKAECAAAVLGPAVRGVHARLDASNVETLFAAADVVVDATDGALTKDWINSAAVRLRTPLVHAAGLRGEGRVLPVRAGGRPCLACLFGRLQQEEGNCADLGVFNGVVAAVGVRAAQEALHVTRAAASTPVTYEVLDLAAGRAVRLEVGADAHCPVCAAEALNAEPYPEPVACLPSTTPLDAALVPDEQLDLREERCPMNLLRARQALEALAPGRLLEIRLGSEGAATVPTGVRRLGHDVVQQHAEGDGVRLCVRRGRHARSTAPLPQRLLARFARQVVLPEVGEAGQQRWLDAQVWLVGQGDELAAAALLLAAAGVGRLFIENTGARATGPGGAPLLPFLRARSSGEVLAHAPADPAGVLRVELPAPTQPDACAGLLVGAHVAHAIQQALLRAEAGSA